MASDVASRISPICSGAADAEQLLTRLAQQPQVIVGGKNMTIPYHQIEQWLVWLRAIRPPGNMLMEMNVNPNQQAQVRQKVKQWLQGSPHGA